MPEETFNLEDHMPAQKRRVYLDHAASTPVHSDVKTAMEPYLADHFGNASALYAQGRAAKEALRDARARVARVFNCNTGEVVFVGSGTESDNLALFGVVRKYKDRGNKVVTVTSEHHAVLHTVEQLKREGHETVLVDVDRDGKVKVDELDAAIDEKTVIVSVMYANNEIGVVQDIPAISKLIKEKKKAWGRGPLDAPFLHTDACQASGYLDLDVKKLGVDLMTINSSKMYGPKGAGVLFVRRGIRLQPIIFGGGQENKLRSGTENIPACVGLSVALELAEASRDEEVARLSELRNYMIEQILKTIPKTVLNGHATDRLANNVNVSILDIEGEAILLYLDEYGVSASTGSACDSSTLDPSHVILALGRPYEFAHGSMRFSLGRSTTREDIDYALKVLKPICLLLRKTSPIDVDMDSYDAGKIALPEAFVGGQTPHFLKNKA